MRILLVFSVAVAASCPTAYAQDSTFEATASAIIDETTARPPRLGELTDRELEAFILEMNESELTLRQKLHLVTRRFLGTEYVLGPLGEGTDGKVDNDPLWDLKHVDCITFVEQVYALCLARDWNGFTKMLQRVRYRGGQVGFGTRNHYTVIDWLPANKWLLREVTDTLAGEKAGKSEKCISKKAFFTGNGVPELGADIPDATRTVTYVPRDVIPVISDQLQTGDLVVWMTGIPGIYASHVGMILESENGPVVCHASRSAGQVTEELLVDYVQRTEWLLGMKFARLQSRAEIIARPLKLDFSLPSSSSGKEQ